MTSLKFRQSSPSPILARHTFSFFGFEYSADGRTTDNELEEKAGIVRRSYIQILLMRTDSRFIAMALSIVHDAKALLGLRLAQLRKAIGWSQETLALESGIARSYLGGVERGQRNISLMNICRLAATLELDPAMLLDFSEVMREAKKREALKNR